MISRYSSKQLMDILEKSENSVADLHSNVNNIRMELDKELTVFRNSMEFFTTLMNQTNEYILQKESSIPNTVVLSDENDLNGTFAKYGITIHPAYISQPTNVFNFLAATGPIFKNNANVSLNDVASPSFASMLMHDAIKGKSTAFAELDTDTVTMSIEVNMNDLFGATTANTIELLPYLSGSFDITSIRIYTIQDYHNKAAAPSFTMNNTIPSVGGSRILLPKNYDIWKVEFDIHLNFKNSAEKYPFGFKHIYFLNANYNMNSNVVFKITRNNYIDWISDAITIHDQNGIRVTSCSDEGIKIYSEYQNGRLISEVATTKGALQTTLAKNIKELYVSIPISSSIISIKFKNIAER